MSTIGPNEGFLLMKSKQASCHVVVWAIQADRLQAGGDLSFPMPAVSVEDLNALLRAKDAETLLDAVSSLGPLCRRGANGHFGGLWMPGRAFLGLVGGEFAPPSAEELRQEVVLAPFFRAYAGAADDFVPATSLRAAVRAVARYAPGDEAFDVLSSESWEGFYVRVEPLRSWTIARNLAHLVGTAFCARREIEGLDDNAAIEAIVARTSFRHSRSLPSVGREAFVIPIARALQTAPCDRAPVVRDLSSVLDLEGPVGTTLPDGLFVLEGRCGGMSDGDSALSGLDGLELAVVPLDMHDSVQDALDGCVRSVGRLFASDGFGVLPCDPSNGASEAHGDSAFGFWNVLGAIWETLGHHRGRTLVLCERCRNVVLASSRGAATRYCSNSCRSTSSRLRGMEHRDRAFEGGSLDDERREHAADV